MNPATRRPQSSDLKTAWPDHQQAQARKLGVRGVRGVLSHPVQRV